MKLSENKIRQLIQESLVRLLIEKKFPELSSEKIDLLAQQFIDSEKVPDGISEEDLKKIHSKIVDMSKDSLLGRKDFIRVTNKSGGGDVHVDQKTLKKIVPKVVVDILNKLLKSDLIDLLGLSTPRFMSISNLDSSILGEKSLFLTSFLLKYSFLPIMEKILNNLKQLNYVDENSEISNLSYSELKDDSFDTHSKNQNTLKQYFRNSIYDFFNNLLADVLIKIKQEKSDSIVTIYRNYIRQAGNAALMQINSKYIDYDYDGEGYLNLSNTNMFNAETLMYNLKNHSKSYANIFLLNILKDTHYLRNILKSNKTLITLNELEKDREILINYLAGSYESFFTEIIGYCLASELIRIAFVESPGRALSRGEGRGFTADMSLGKVIRNKVEEGRFSKDATIRKGTMKNAGKQIARKAKKFYVKSMKDKLKDFVAIHYAGLYGGNVGNIIDTLNYLKFIGNKRSTNETSAIPYPKGFLKICDRAGKGEEIKALALSQPGKPIGCILDGFITSIFNQDVASDLTGSGSSTFGGARGERSSEDWTKGQGTKFTAGNKKRSTISAAIENFAESEKEAIHYDLEGLKEKLLKNPDTYPGGRYYECFVDNWRIKKLFSYDWYDLPVQNVEMYGALRQIMKLSAQLGISIVDGKNVEKELSTKEKIQILIHYKNKFTAEELATVADTKSLKGLKETNYLNSLKFLMD